MDVGKLGPVRPCCGTSPGTDHRNGCSERGQTDALICPSALACLSLTAQYAGAITQGDLTLVRTDNANAAMAELRGRMAPEVLKELGRLIAWEIASRERMA